MWQQLSLGGTAFEIDTFEIDPMDKRETLRLFFASNGGGLPRGLFFKHDRSENPLLKVLGLGRTANWTLEGCCWRIATMYFHPRLQTILGKSLWSSSRQTILTKTPPQVYRCFRSGFPRSKLNFSLCWFQLALSYVSGSDSTLLCYLGFKASQAHDRPVALVSGKIIDWIVENMFAFAKSPEGQKKANIKHQLPKRQENKQTQPNQTNIDTPHLAAWNPESAAGRRGQWAYPVQC